MSRDLQRSTEAYPLERPFTSESEAAAIIVQRLQLGGGKVRVRVATDDIALRLTVFVEDLLGPAARQRLEVIVT